MPEVDVSLPTNLPSYSGMLFRNLETYPGQLYTTPGLMSAKEEGRKSRRDITRAARHVERYSEHIRGGLDRKADMVVGPRLRLRATPDFEILGITDKAQQKKIRRSLEREFNNWAYDRRLLQDAEGDHDFGGLLWMLYRNTQGPDGECAGVIHYDEGRARTYRTRWATYVSVIDPDRIETPPEQAGNPNVDEGLVLDTDGRMVGFYCRRKHPSDSIKSLDDIKFTLVPRETATGRPVGFHWFLKTRAGQLRGVSKLVTILKQSGMLDKFDEAYLAAATINQVLATYIESASSTAAVAGTLRPAGESSVNDIWGLFQNKLSYYNEVKMRVGGARIPVLPPGDKINMSAVNRAINDPTLFRNGFLREFASSVGISFEQISKNFSDANYSAARAALLDIWQGILRERGWFGHLVAGLIYEAVIEEALKKGRVQEVTADMLAKFPFDEYRTVWCGCLWTGPGFPQIDPEKEAKAAKELLSIRLDSHQELVAQRGRDFDDVLDEWEDAIAEADERGFLLEPLAPGTPGAEEATIDADAADAAEKPKPKRQQAGQRDGDGDGTVQEGQQ